MPTATPERAQAETVSRRTRALRDVLRGRLVTGARAHAAAAGTGITPRLVDDVCRQLGVTRPMFRSLFPTDGDFLDRINETLVDECASRLAAGVAAFDPPLDVGDPLVAAATALAEARPLTRSGMLIRAGRRLRALEFPEERRQLAEAERRYAAALLDVFDELMTRLRRTFTWPPLLAVRVILDTYERSFEMWIIEGNTEDDFASSPYARRTLPRLLREMSAP